METTKHKRISKAHAAQIAGVSIRTIKRWAVAGRITEERDPLTGRPWYLAKEIEAVTKRGQIGP